MQKTITKTDLHRHLSKIIKEIYSGTVMKVIDGKTRKPVGYMRVIGPGRILLSQNLNAKV